MPGGTVCLASVLSLAGPSLGLLGGFRFAERGIEVTKGRLITED